MPMKIPLPVLLVVCSLGSLFLSAAENVKKKDVTLAETKWIILSVGSDWDFKVVDPQPLKINKELKLKREWRKNGISLNQTGSTYSLNGVTMADSGSYTVVFKGQSESETAPLHVSVVEYFTNQSNGGYLTTPIGAFTAQTGDTVCSDSAVAFNRYKVFMPFDGTNVQTPSVDFPNISRETNLLVSTCTNINGATLDTSLQVVENFYPMAERACNDNFMCGANAKLSSCITTGLLATQNYRVIVYYKYGTLGTCKNVTFRWKYSNGFDW
jgi:hypothetical protein